MLISILGLISLILNIVYTVSSIYCSSFYPATNKATDDNNKNKFRILHNVSGLTLVI